MVGFDFYADIFHGGSIPEEEWQYYESRAEDQLRQYKRIYTVSAPEEGAEEMAVCAIAEAMYGFDAIANNEKPVQSASIGSVSVSYGPTASIDISGKAQEKGLLKAARVYLDIYRGCGR